MAIFVLILGAVMLVSAEISAVSPELGTKLQAAMKENTVDPEKEFDCLMFRLEDIVLKMKEKISKIERKLANNATSLTKPTSPGKVSQAFSAYISDSNGLHVTGTLRFTKTLTNIGRSYNGHTGVFTAAADGVYVFHFHAETYSYSKSCTLDLLHQNNTVVKTYGYDSSGFLALGNDAIIEMKKGDVVQVSVIPTSACYLRGKHTTFSGFEIPNF